MDDGSGSPNQLPKSHLLTLFTFFLATGRNAEVKDYQLLCVYIYTQYIG